MATDKKEMGGDEKDSSIKPDPGTTNTTDPQEHMEGPLSSLMQGVSDEAEEEGGKSEDTDK